MLSRAVSRTAAQVDVDTNRKLTEKRTDERLSACLSISSPNLRQPAQPFYLAPGLACPLIRPSVSLSYLRFISFVRSRIYMFIKHFVHLRIRLSVPQPADSPSARSFVSSFVLPVVRLSVHPSVYLTVRRPRPSASPFDRPICPSVRPAVSSVRRSIRPSIHSFLFPSDRSSVCLSV